MDFFFFRHVFELLQLLVQLLLLHFSCMVQDVLIFPE